MQQKRKKKVLLTTPEQRAAIASTVRMEMLEYFHAGPATVAELAEQMGRTPNSLYHHVGLLQAAGILRQVGHRRSGSRQPAVYDVTAEVFELATSEDGAANTEAELKTVRMILRKAEREFAEAMETQPEAVLCSEFFTGRMRARLSRGSQRQVMSHLREIQKVFTEELARELHSSAKPQACSFTAVFLPSGN